MLQVYSCYTFIVIFLCPYKTVITFYSFKFRILNNPNPWIIAYLIINYIVITMNYNVNTINYNVDTINYNVNIINYKGFDHVFLLELILF